MHLLPHLCSETTCGATPSGHWSVIFGRVSRSRSGTRDLSPLRAPATYCWRAPAVQPSPPRWPWGTYHWAFSSARCSSSSIAPPPPLGTGERSDGSVHLVLNLSSPRGASVKWEEQVYVDLRLPFGARSSPLPFYFVRGCSQVLHYLDDYFLVRDSHAACANDMHAFHDLCRDLCAPLAPEKLVLPTCCLQFLGVTLDSSLQEMCLPLDKLAQLRDCLPAWWTWQKCTNRVHCC